LIIILKLSLAKEKQMSKPRKYTNLNFSVYEAKILYTKEVTDRPFTQWTKIAQINNKELKDIDFAKLDENRAFRDFDEQLYYMLDESEEIYDGLELDDGVYVVANDYENDITFTLDEDGYVVSSTKKIQALKKLEN